MARSSNAHRRYLLAAALSGREGGGPLILPDSMAGFDTIASEPLHKDRSYIFEGGYLKCVC
jgi:hypothetical protein